MSGIRSNRRPSLNSLGKENAPERGPGGRVRRPGGNRREPRPLTAGASRRGWPSIHRNHIRAATAASWADKRCKPGLLAIRTDYRHALHRAFTTDELGIGRWWHRFHVRSLVLYPT